MRTALNDRDDISLQVRHLNVVIEQQCNDTYQSLTIDIDKIKKILNSYIDEDSSTTGFLQNQISLLAADKVKIQQNLAGLEHKFELVYSEFTHEDKGPMEAN